jgi:hypothetical protein
VFTNAIAIAIQLVLGVAGSPQVEGEEVRGIEE